MANKTAARSSARTTSSKGTSRPAAKAAQPVAPRRKAAAKPAAKSGAKSAAKSNVKPAARNTPSAVAVAASAGGRAVRATWLMAARGAGSTARSVGRARDIEPGHRRDGIALGLLALAVVIAAASWFDAARPVGGWIDAMLRNIVGGSVVLLPLLLAAAAVLLMRKL